MSIITGYGTRVPRTGTGSRLGGEVRRKGGRGGLLSAPLESPGRELHVLGPRLRRVQRNLVLVKPLGIPVLELNHLFASHSGDFRKYLPVPVHVLTLARGMVQVWQS